MSESLFAISPIDGRYHNQTQVLSPYFSEFGLIKYRVLVEVRYFLALTKVLPNLKSFPADKQDFLLKWAEDFSEENAITIKNLEKVTNHDVKAVEYFLKQKFEENGLEEFAEFIHFGLTSQDVNNTSIPLSYKEAFLNVAFPRLLAVIEKLADLSVEWEEIPMLARTHGQPASPTRLGKEIKVFVERLQKQAETLLEIPHAAKFGGATGNFNAHSLAYPGIEWEDFADDFVNNDLGLSRSTYTTQIEHYDFIAAACDNWKRINNILIDFCRDVWAYISMDYFKQQIKAGEIGSSAMPHKVNPIDFENAEGNLGVANAFFEHLAAKLPISRLQRDLTDSTVLRNLGVPLAHTLIAMQSIQKGLSKLLLNESAIHNDLDRNWAVVAEAIQTVLRKEGFDKPYEMLKELTRKNEQITQNTIHDFIDNLKISDIIKQNLKNISPFNYLGTVK